MWCSMSGHGSTTTTLFLNFLAQQVDACKDGKSQLDLKHFFGLLWVEQYLDVEMSQYWWFPKVAWNSRISLELSARHVVWTLSHFCGLFLLGVTRHVMDTILYHSFHPSALLVFQSALKQKQWPLSPEPLWTPLTYTPFFTVLYLQLSTATFLSRPGAILVFVPGLRETCRI